MVCVAQYAQYTLYWVQQSGEIFDMEMYEYLCVYFLLVLMFVYLIYLHLILLSEVIRAEAETCLLIQNMNMKINLSMLLLSLMIINLVHTKVQMIRITMF